MHQNSIRVHNIDAIYFHSGVFADVLRLDEIHPLISGNKWFKLKMYLREAEVQKKQMILTYGGAYSNHILATAAACKENGFRSIGIIRGEKPMRYSKTLEDAQSLGMKIIFISREAYKKKIIPDEIYSSYPQQEIYIINEGGYGLPGRVGAESILKGMAGSKYTHILTAVGTGTTLAGLVAGSKKEQQVIGISVLKNNFSISKAINGLLPGELYNHYTLLHQFHFGGYAKHTPPLIDFMNNWFLKTGIPSDFVYTGKLFYAVNDLVNHNYFQKGNKLLIIHSGGLQSNHSLLKGTLIF